MSEYILIVDDNPNNLRLLITLLQEQHYEVRPASNGSRALAMAGRETPALVLLDINMPEMDGYEVCRRLKAEAATADVPILFISANDEPLDKVRGFEAGGVDYLSKPFDALELHARVRTHLELKRSRDQLQAMNQRLQEANAMLQGLNQIKDEFLRMVSHDLKNPLSSILLFSRYMESRSLSDTKAQEIGKLITQAGRRMFRLIEDLLDSDKVEQGQLQLANEAISPAPLLDELCREFAPRAAEKQQRIESRLDPALRMRGDAQRLHQIGENLLSNALKFSPPGALIQLQLRRDGDRLLIEVFDQGPGLSAQDQQRLFQKFVRLSARPTGQEHSSGLGLYITARLVAAMGGEISCLSPLGPQGGACFGLSFAALPADTSD